jgi:predicted membrane metal-binding protein
VNFILAGLFLSIGVWKGGLLKKVRVGIGKYLITALILLIYVASNISWAKVYADTVLLVNNVHCQAGRWLHNNLPAGTNIAAFDVGAIRYYSELPVTDIAGLTDNEALKYVYAGKVVDLMRKENSQYFVMVENYEKPTFIGKGKRITQNYNLYERMGIFKEIDRSIDLEPVVEFSVPFEVHYRAYKLLHHHGPIIRIFKIIWLEHPED